MLRDEPCRRIQPNAPIAVLARALLGLAPWPVAAVAMSCTQATAPVPATAGDSAAHDGSALCSPRWCGPAWYVVDASGRIVGISVPDSKGEAEDCQTHIRFAMDAKTGLLPSDWPPNQQWYADDDNCQNAVTTEFDSLSTLRARDPPHVIWKGQWFAKAKESRQVVLRSRMVFVWPDDNPKWHYECQKIEPVTIEKAYGYVPEPPQIIADWQPPVRLAYLAVQPCASAE